MRTHYELIWNQPVQFSSPGKTELIKFISDLHKLERELHGVIVTLIIVSGLLTLPSKERVGIIQ